MALLYKLAHKLLQLLIDFTTDGRVLQYANLEVKVVVLRADKHMLKFMQK